MPHTKSDFESYGKDHLTFDCPWCGAISGIDPSHEGDSFACPECKNVTKITPENTRRGHLTEAPPDAPHHEEAAAAAAAAEAKKKAAHEQSAWESYGKDHLTFDCPWCGAISGVHPSHLGEHYDCPECHRATKLTEATTRKAEIADPPPDAPHLEESASSKLPLLVGLGILVVAAVVVAVLASSPSDEGDGQGEPGPVTTAQQPGDPDPGRTPGQPLPGEPMPGPATATPADGPGTTPPADEPPPSDAPPVAPPPDEGPPDEGPPDEGPPEEESPEEAAALAAVQEAAAALADAHARLRAWETDNPSAARCLQLAAACEEVNEEIRRGLGELDPDAATVAEARAYNEAVHAYIAAGPERVLVATELMTHLNADLIRAPAVQSWENLNFFEPRVRETLRYLHDVMCAVDPTAYEALLGEVAEAEAALAAAQAAAED